MIYIGTHVMPWEVGEFRDQMRRFRMSLSVLSKEALLSFTFIPTLNLNEKVINWGLSLVEQDFYINHFNQSLRLIEDYIDVKERIGYVYSTSDALKKNIEEHLTPEDYYVWIDPDIVYPVSFWAYVYGLVLAKPLHTEYVIYSPEINKLWDSSWDLLVTPEELNLPYGDKAWKEAKYEKVILKDLYALPEIHPLPYVKIGGGFGNMISANTLIDIGIPDYYTMYGGIDTYIMTGCQELKNQGKLEQFKISPCLNIQDILMSDKEFWKGVTPPKVIKDKQREYNEQRDSVFQRACSELITKLRKI